MFIVQTKMFFDPAVESQVLELARLGAPIARKQPGLVSFTQHIAQDRSHTMAYWVWETEQHHLDCMTAPDWAPFNEKWEALIESGEIRFELTTYEVLDV